MSTVLPTWPATVQHALAMCRAVIAGTRPMLTVEELAHVTNVLVDATDDPPPWAIAPVTHATACRACRWWEGDADQRANTDPNRDAEHADCRRHAPIQGDGASYTRDATRWPTTEADDWCGDFERIPTPEPLTPPERHPATR